MSISRGTSKLTKKTFDKLFLEVVDDSLASLGESAKQAIYFHLETKFSLPRNEIPSRIADFGSGLEKIFGPGANFIEILIMKRLHSKLHKPITWDEGKELVFSDYVMVARKSFLKKDEN
jgi:hypothetical protein